MSEKRESTPESVSKLAVAGNGVMAVGQVAAAAVFGNVGFFNEAMHNFFDSASFFAKGIALKSTPERAIKLRKYAVGVLIAGGIVGIGAGEHQLSNDEHENHSTPAIAVAAAGAVINGAIALKTHAASHEDEDGEPCADGAHEDTKGHALADALTGALYGIGLFLELKGVSGAANYSILTNGAIHLSTAEKTIEKIISDQKTLNGN